MAKRVSQKPETASGKAHPKTDSVRLVEESELTPKLIDNREGKRKNSKSDLKKDGYSNR